MGTSSDKPKKRTHLWKKVLIHFSLCFVMGFFIGFAPTASTFSPFSVRPSAISDLKNEAFNRSQFHELKHEAFSSDQPDCTETEREIMSSKEQLIVVTTTRLNDPFKAAFLWRMASTLRMVPPPLLWIVVEVNVDAPATARILRRTGVMYRHIIYRENFTDGDAHAYYQKNLALSHIEQHRLSGIVHFAGEFNVYPLQLFEEIREIE